MSRVERFEAEFYRRLHQDPVSNLEAYCRARVAALPHGSRGRRAAGELLTAIPAACRLGWWDETASAPSLFRKLKSAGLITTCPSDTDIPAALRLVGSVCDLVTQRSPRRWTVWFSSACDPDLPLGASIREAVTLQRPPSQSSSPASPLPADGRAEGTETPPVVMPPVVTPSVVPSVRTPVTGGDTELLAIGTLREELGPLREEIGALAREQGTLQNVVATLLEVIANENATLRRNIAALRSNNATLRMKNAALWSKNATLRSKNATLRSKNAALRSNSASLRALLWRRTAFEPAKPEQKPELVIEAVEVRTVDAETAPTALELSVVPEAGIEDEDDFWRRLSKEADEIHRARMRDALAACAKKILTGK